MGEIEQHRYTTYEDWYNPVTGDDDAWRTDGIVEFWTPRIPVDHARSLGDWLTWAPPEREEVGDDGT